jgi:hypothetical protein
MTYPERSAGLKGLRQHRLKGRPHSKVSVRIEHRIFSTSVQQSIEGTGQLLLKPLAGMIRSIATEFCRLLTCSQFSRLLTKLRPLSQASHGTVQLFIEGLSGGNRFAAKLDY